MKKAVVLRARELYPKYPGGIGVMRTRPIAATRIGSMDAVPYRRFAQKESAAIRFYHDIIP